MAAIASGMLAITTSRITSADEMSEAHLSAEQTLTQIYKRVTGQKLVRRPDGLPPSGNQPDAATIARWERYIQEGRREPLYTELLDQRAFASANFANFVSKLSNEEASPLQLVDDFQIQIMVAAFSDRDIQPLFTHGVTAASKVRGILNRPDITAGEIFDAVKDGNLSLVFQTQDQRQSGTPALPAGTVEFQQSDVGLLSSRGFMTRNLNAGTNRRPVRAAFDLFLCSKIDTWKDTSLPDLFVGRDIDRAPGKDPKVYRDSCRGCHAPMDAYRGAWANYDFPRGYSEQVVQKYNINPTVYPGGYVTRSADWLNLLTSPSSQSYFGWRGPTGGGDLSSFGRLIADSERFQKCMVKRVIEAVCPYTDYSDMDRNDDPELDRLSVNFREKGYQLRGLFRSVLLSPACR
jgi:hypothetical protein